MKKYKIDRFYLGDFEQLKIILVKFIKLHFDLGRHYKKLQEYYESEHEILKRQMNDPTKPNNKLVNNYAKYITDIAVGYFLGVPVTYNAKNEAFDNTLKDLFSMSDEADENSELAKQCSMKGIVYEIVYQDSEGNTRFKLVDPSSAFLIYDTSIQENILLGVRFYNEDNLINDTTITKVELYTNSMIYYFELVDDKLKELNIEEHYFGEVPLIEYINNEECKGDFETVLTLIDAYNNSQSDSANDFEYFTDAYLALVNMSGTTSDDIQRLKEQRIILLDENGDANWLVKDINDSAIENFKDRLKKDISKFSMVPSLTDEDFAGNTSGISLKYKLWGLEQLTSIKEKKFVSALKRRLKLICNILSIKGNSFDYREVSIAFYRNLPANLLEISDMLSKLGNVISEETKLEQIPFIMDVKAELQRKEQETLNQMQDLGFTNTSLPNGSDINGNTK